MEPENWRPWGYYEILTDAEDHKVKRITVLPEKRLSLQFHHKRSEHWVIVSGWGRVTRGEEKITVMPGSHVYIPTLMRHRIENTHLENPLVFIETQLGEYFGEDDIVRIEDDFGRE